MNSIPWEWLTHLAHVDCMQTPAVLHSVMLPCFSKACRALSFFFAWVLSSSCFPGRGNQSKCKCSHVFHLLCNAQGLNYSLNQTVVCPLQSQPLKSCFSPLSGSQQYLEAIHQLYEEWLIKQTQFKVPCPVLVSTIYIFDMFKPVNHWWRNKCFAFSRTHWAVFVESRSPFLLW